MEVDVEVSVEPAVNRQPDDRWQYLQSSVQVNKQSRVSS